MYSEGHVVVLEDRYEAIKVMQKHQRQRQHHPQSMRQDSDLRIKFTALRVVDMWMRIYIQGAMGRLTTDPCQ